MGNEVFGWWWFGDFFVFDGVFGVFFGWESKCGFEEFEKWWFVGIGGINDENVMREFGLIMLDFDELGFMWKWYLFERSRIFFFFDFFGVVDGIYGVVGIIVVIVMCYVFSVSVRVEVIVGNRRRGDVEVWVSWFYGRVWGRSSESSGVGGGVGWGSRSIFGFVRNDSDWVGVGFIIEI